MNLKQIKTVGNANTFYNMKYYEVIFIQTMLNVRSLELNCEAANAITQEAASAKYVLITALCARSFSKSIELKLGQ